MIYEPCYDAAARRGQVELIVEMLRFDGYRVGLGKWWWGGPWKRYRTIKFGYSVNSLASTTAVRMIRSNPLGGRRDTAAALIELRAEAQLVKARCSPSIEEIRAMIEPPTLEREGGE